MPYSRQIVFNSYKDRFKSVRRNSYDRDSADVIIELIREVQELREELNKLKEKSNVEK